MRFDRHRSRPSAVLALLCGLGTIASQGQTFAAGVTTVAPAMRIVNSTFNRPAVPGHHRSAPEKLIYARVRDGVYTVDGMVAKIRLNYDVQGSRFMYLFVPGMGTAVLSVTAAPDAVVRQASLHGDDLTFDADGHRFKLTGVSLESDRGETPTHLYVHLDRRAWRLSRLPMVGYGNKEEMPYEWPGALPASPTEESLTGPPVPASLLPRTGTRPSAGKAPGTTSTTLQPVSLR